MDAQSELNILPPTASSASMSPSWNFASLGDERQFVLPFLEAFGVDIDTSVSHDRGPVLSLNDAAAFLDYLRQAQASPQVLATITRSFEIEVLREDDIHSLALKLNVSTRNHLIEAYLRLMGNLGQGSSKSALLRAADAGTASLLAVFGGQGTHNGDCLNELRKIYNTYKPFLQSLIQAASSLLQRLARISASAGNHVKYDFELLQWIENPEIAPDRADIAIATYSFPINGLISLAHYCITCRVLKINPGQMRASLAGTTGHSQGIIIAAAIAASDSWKTFAKAAESAIELLFWIGSESHEGTPYSPKPSSVAHSAENDALLSSMLSIRGLKLENIARILEEANIYLKDHEKAYLALVNSSDKVIIAGPRKTLHGIRALLDAKRAPEGLDQAKIPFPRRKPIIDYEFLPISAAFHCPHLEKAANAVLDHVNNNLFSGLDLVIPMYHTETGENLNQVSDQNLTRLLVQMVMLKRVDWQKACIHPGLTHILDFGPSRTTSLLQEQVQGSGIRIIIASELTASSESFGGKQELFSKKLPMLAPNWSNLYGPKITTDAWGKASLSTKMNRIIGMPPIMVAGMTPTTVHWDFVSCVTNAGYHIEIAGGGYSQAAKFEEAIRKLAASLPPHRGITCNLIYVSPRSLAWQIPLIRQLISEGVPIHGLTIGAGVPSVDVANEYIETLGLQHISFKPGSLQAVHQVLSIAESNPSFPIGLQWTGGRAGGHHSYEDFHAPLLKTYGLIRRHSNIILTVGSGFGDAQGILPYLTGTWSEMFGYARMPVDGILLGSRMMAAKEAHTSAQVKELIAQTKGTSESDWHKTYNGPAGGVITVKSEMGEPIHKIATRGVVLWSDLDESIFSIKDHTKRLAALQNRRDEIIGRLITDYAKPWFAVDSHANAIEIDDMTYLECLQRIAALMYVRGQQRWIDKTYETFFYDFVYRAQERLDAVADLPQDQSLGPFEFLDSFTRSYPQAETEILYPEDVSFFIGICKRRDQKPVNFIPCLDENFETWFKKDSLWQAEDLDAVIDNDPQRVCIIHGPVAAKYTTMANESAADILDTISNNLVDLLNLSLPDNSMPESSSRKERRSIQLPSNELNFAHIVTYTMQRVYHFISPISATEKTQLVKNLFFSNKNWASACLTDEYVYRDGQRLVNTIRMAFIPCDGDILAVNYHPGTRDIGSIVLSRPAILSDQFYPAFSLSSADGEQIILTLQSPPSSEDDQNTISLSFLCPQNGLGEGLKEVTESRQAKIREFYGSCWSIDSTESTINVTVGSEFSSGSVTLSRKVVDDFVSCISRPQGDHLASRYPAPWVPLDLGILVAWPALTKPLLVSNIAGDIFRLLHRSNSFELCLGAEAFKIDDVLETSSCINKIVVQPHGKLVEVVATIQRRGEAVMKVTSAFFIQGKASHDGMVESIEETEMILDVNSPKLQALVLSRSWLKFEKTNLPLLGKTLLFRIRSSKAQAQLPGMFDLSVSGQVKFGTLENSNLHIGEVQFANPSCGGNPVTDFLQRYGSSPQLHRPLTNPGWSAKKPWLIRVPQSGKEYSDVSTDRNPIHVCPVFAGFAQLPGPITHGMYTSAVIRMAIEKEVAESDASRFRRWTTSFDGMVRAGDLLRIEMQHVSMIEGRMAFDIRVYNHESNDKVLQASAEVEQDHTAYIFCGQGSQVKNMGMALYESDPVARAMWDKGDRYLLDSFGFSLLDLVRKDPKELTVYFGGPKGRKIRANYLGMTRKTWRDGQEIILPVIDGLTPESESHTFRDPRGLLFSTQFAQPVITLMNLAEMASLKARGLVQKDALFAGHSLGEYSALAACTTSFMELDDLLSAVFYRGLVMQVAMKRDSAGRTDFSMVAVNPSKVGKDFKEESLKLLIQHITSSTGLLLEVVNYNVEGQQYVCAGHLQALWILGQSCDQLATGDHFSRHNPEDILSVVRRHAPAAKLLPQPIELVRGRATVPLSGIDIPFHSSYLRAGIDLFRECLLDKIREDEVVPEQLIGKFIPNVMGTPFSLDREYVDKAAKITGSKMLRSLLDAPA